MIIIVMVMMKILIKTRKRRRKFGSWSQVIGFSNGNALYQTRSQAPQTPLLRLSKRFNLVQIRR